MTRLALHELVKPNSFEILQHSNGLGVARVLPRAASHDLNQIPLFEPVAL